MDSSAKQLKKQSHMKERLKHNNTTGRYIKYTNKHNKVYVYPDSDNPTERVIVMHLGRQR